MTIQITLQCMPADCSNQLKPSSETSQSQAQDMMSSHALKPSYHSSKDDVIPCYEISQLQTQEMMLSQNAM